MILSSFFFTSGFFKKQMEYLICFHSKYIDILLTTLEWIAAFYFGEAERSSSQNANAQHLFQLYCTLKSNKNFVTSFCYHIYFPDFLTVWTVSALSRGGRNARSTNNPLNRSPRVQVAWASWESTCACLSRCWVQLSNNCRYYIRDKRNQHGQKIK